MKRSWLLLLAVVVVTAVAVSAAARLPRRAKVAAAPAAAAAPSVEIALEVEGGAVHPSPVSVPKGHDVVLTVVNRGAVPVTLALAGYEDRVAPGAIAAGATWHGRFTAERPGDDFSWLVDGRPAGRLAVTGSHLVEGHR